MLNFLFRKRKPNPLFEEIPVVTLGVAGAPSSGKTVLIDSLFRLMGSYRPDYISSGKFRDPATIDLVEVESEYPSSPLQGFYKNIAYLNNWVTQHFHKVDIRTEDNGDAIENTYKALLLEKGRPKCIFLVRNISGELFNTYFQTTVGTVTFKQSLHEYFKEFWEATSRGTPALNFAQPKSFYPKDDLLGQFSSYLDEHEKNWKTEQSAVKKFFYAYIFFKESQFFIYCLDYLSSSANFNKVDNFNKAVDQTRKVHNCFYVITKIDQYFITDRLLSNKDLDDSENSVYELRQIQKLGGLTDYWKTIRYIYKNIDAATRGENGSGKLINEQGRKYLRHIWEDKIIPEEANKLVVNSYIKDNVFYSSATFHCSRNRFISINADFEPKDITDTSYWHSHINRARTSIGVLELLLRILNEINFDVNSLDILPKGRHDNEAIYKKTIGVDSRKA